MLRLVLAVCICIGSGFTFSLTAKHEQGLSTLVVFLLVGVSVIAWIIFKVL
jgi:hypothetical protein